LILFSAN